MSTHDSRISVAKALCIILMVVGHSGCPEFMRVFIYQFHMPCFFFVSGFLLKQKYINEIRAFGWRRFKGLWWPFVKWSVLFLLLHNVLTALHLYETRYSWSDMGYKLFHIITLTGSEQLLGGFWFLKELLYASIFSVVGLWTLQISFPKYKDMHLQMGVILTVLFMVLAYGLSIVPFKIPTIGSKTMLASSFFIAGYTYQKTHYQMSRWDVGILLLLGVWIITFFFTGSMGVVQTGIFLYFFVAMAGAIGVLHIAGRIHGVWQRFLDYVGDKTLYILTFHFISFKLVSWGFIVCYQ